MANPDHLARLRMGVKSWNAWRDHQPDLDANLSNVDLAKCALSEANLTRANLEGANLSEADLRWASLKRAKMSRAVLTEADLSGAELQWAVLNEADLSGTVLNGATLVEAQLSGASLSRAALWEANLRGADLHGADLSQAYLSKANLGETNLSGSNLSEAKLIGANLRHADLADVNLNGADLVGADLIRATLTNANLAQSNLTRVELIEANLAGAKLTGALVAGADLSDANLSQADLLMADFRSATLQRANLNGANATGIRLWETQRAGWSIKGIVCEFAFWDEDAKVATEYLPGEFEKLYSEQTCIELFYQGGVSTFELNTLPALLRHLSRLHPGSNIRLKSVDEAAGGARIAISVGDADAETAEKIKSDAIRVHRSQLALREQEILRLQIQKDYLESFVSERLVKAMFAAAGPQIAFNAPVYAPALPSGNASVHIEQIVNDNSRLLALIEKITERCSELELSEPDAARLDSELETAKSELQKKEPDKSILSKSVGFIQKIASEASIKAAGKLGEAAVSADWNGWLHQLAHLIHQIK